MSNEANTCRKYVEPKLNQAGWNTEPYDYYEQYYFTNGKIRPKNQRQPRGKRKFADDGNSLRFTVYSVRNG
jgi:type I restriction enzyme R subunit